MPNTFSRQSLTALAGLVRRRLWLLLLELNLWVIVPTLLGITFIAFLVQFNQGASVEGVAVPIRVWEQPEAGGLPDRAEIHQRLQAAADMAHVDTHLSTQPFWFSLSATAPAPGPWALYFPSRDAFSLRCWGWPADRLLGEADRTMQSGALAQSRAGFVLRLPALPATQQLLCSANFRGPARISAEAWNADDYTLASVAFQRLGATIEAGIGILALFMLLTAAVNRSALYLMFAGWLLLNLRMAAISSGTDAQWFGYMIGTVYQATSRQWTVGLYFITSITLFCKLFEDDLRAIRARLSLAIVQSSAVLVLLACAFASFETSLRFVWVCAAVSISLMLYLLASILRQTRSRSAIWYLLSILLTAVANLNEVLAAAIGHHHLLVMGLNSVTAAIGSALLTCLALAEQLRTDRLERVVAQKALQQTYLDSPIGLFTVIDGEHIVQSNPAFRHMLRDVQPPRRDSLAELFGEGVWREINALVHPAKLKTSTYIETRLSGDTRSDEDAKWFAIQASSADGQVVEGSLQDITEKVQATQKLRFWAEHDVLTGCLNWRGLSSLFSALGPPMSLAYLDLDRFKLVNDLYGHAAGDRVLRQVTERIQSQLGSDDLLARIGGDEFLIAFLNTRIGDAQAIASRIVNLVSSIPFVIDNRRFVLGVSCGIVEAANFRSADTKEIVAAADSACRMAKKRPGERLVCIEKSSNFFESQRDELQLIEQLEQGITPRGLFLVMQPEISMTDPSGSLNFEVLLRLRKPNGEVLGAGMIIEAAESHGQSALIDRWVVTQTFAWLEKHAHELPNTQFVGVNLSGGSLNDEVFIEELFTLFAAHKTALSKIILEITETVALTDMGNMRSFIVRARAMGARVGLDDFGAGYSSFNYLKHLSVDALKLDGSMVKDTPTNASSMAIVVALGGLLRGLGLKSIGEFAESLEVIKVLAVAGIDYAQGYAISRPVLPERILEAHSTMDLIEDPQVRAFFHNIERETEILRELVIDAGGIDALVTQKLLSV